MAELGADLPEETVQQGGFIGHQATQFLTGMAQTPLSSVAFALAGLGRQLVDFDPPLVYHVRCLTRLSFPEDDGPTRHPAYMRVRSQVGLMGVGQSGKTGALYTLRCIRIDLGPGGSS